MFNWFTDLPANRKVMFVICVVLLVLAYLVHANKIHLF